MDGEKPNRTYVILTAMKFIEMAVGSYASHLIVTRYVYRGPLNVMYITLPTFVLISLIIFVQRIIFHKKRPLATVFEAVVCAAGFVCYMVQVCVLTYLLPRTDYVHEDEEGMTSTIPLERFRRTMRSAITTTITACFYLLDALLSADIVLTRSGIPLWSVSEYPNLEVDLPPLIPLTMIYPWEGRLVGESVFKRVREIKKAKIETSNK